MDLFIGNLPDAVTYNEILVLFRGFTREGTFRIEEKRLDNGEKVRYVVARFVQEKAALRLLKKYHGYSYRGRRLVIREYVYRRYGNERRALNWRDKPWRAGERRRKERRLNETAPQPAPPRPSPQAEKPKPVAKTAAEPQSVRRERVPVTGEV